MLVRYFISVMPYSDPNDDLKTSYVAVANDGTLWQTYGRPHQSSDSSIWQQLPDLPQP